MSTGDEDLVSVCVFWCVCEAAEHCGLDTAAGQVELYRQLLQY